MDQILVLIPAYEPGPQLPQLVAELLQLGVRHILIINDGSSSDCDTFFDQCTCQEQVHLIRHQGNRGKGAALRTGFQYAVEKGDVFSGVVTADADGQHRPEDIVRVCRETAGSIDAFILKSRDFQGDVPWRSRFGNDMTRGVCRLLFGRRIKDTQTGLRGLSVRLLHDLLLLQAERVMSLKC